MESYKDILLFDILQSIEVKNKTYKSIIKDCKAIKHGGKIYTYDSIIRQTAPFQTSYYCKHISNEHFKLMAEYGNAKLKLAYYVYNMIKNRYDMEKRKSVRPNYSHNIRINANEAIEYMELKRSTYYDLLKTIAKDTAEAIVVNDGEARISNIDFVPPLLLEEDGSFSLNYMLTPFKNTTEVLTYEEDAAIEKYSNGTPYERKRWSNRIMQRDVISLKDCAESKDNTIYGFVMRYIAKDMYDNDGYLMNSATYDIVFDYKAMIEKYRAESGSNASEYAIRNTVKGLVKTGMLFEDGRTKNRNKIYHINTSKLNL